MRNGDYGSYRARIKQPPSKETKMKTLTFISLLILVTACGSKGKDSGNNTPYPSPNNLYEVCINEEVMGNGSPLASAEDYCAYNCPALNGGADCYAQFN